MSTVSPIACNESKARNERLQVFLVPIAQAPLTVGAIAEVMATIEREVRAGAEAQHLRDESRERPGRLFVRGPARQRRQRGLQILHELQHLLPMGRAIPKRTAVADQADVGQQIDRRTLWNRAKLDPGLAHQPRKPGARETGCGAFEGS